MDVRTELFINGAWIKPSTAELMDVVNPATEEIVSRFPLAGAADVDRAVDAARRAFPAWSARPLTERLGLLQSLYDLFAKEREDLSQRTTAEMGAPITFARQFMTELTMKAIARTIEIARDYSYETQSDGTLFIREAFGVVGVITPWNNPAFMAAIKVFPALAAGCTVIHKPAENTPLDAFFLAEMIDKVGFPNGVYNLVTGTGRVVGEAIDGHSGLDLLSFTGSTGAGRRIAELAARGPTPAIMELGGKSATIILDDADLEGAVRDSIPRVFMNAGQLCGSWTRMLVPRAKLSEATEQAVTLANAYKLGDPLDPATEMGPLVSAKQHKTVTDYIRIGLSEGAKLVAGGTERPAHLTRGYYVPPTIFTGVSNTMRIAREEIFGPVLCLIPHDGDDEAVAIANDSDYGLHGGVFSGDAERGLRVARRIRTGQVHLNGFKFDIDVPFWRIPSIRLWAMFRADWL
jgi:acyl-CoA reductase-like NAD-dependent aldehyde dehydrogenase